MKRIELPYMRIKQVNSLLKKLSPAFLEKKDIDATELSRNLGVKRSSVSNMLTTVKSLRLLDGRGKYNFTEAGKKYVTFLLRNNEEKAREVLKGIINDLEYIGEIRQWLEQKGRLAIEDIGNHIALKFNQKWENRLTVKAYGAAVSSILEFIGEASYRAGTLFVAEAGTQPESLSAPNVTVRKIRDIVEALFPEGKDFKELSNKLNTKEGRLSSELLCCMELGLVERVARGFYRLTDTGKNMLKPDLSDDEKRLIFRESLLASRYGKFVKDISHQTTVNEVGNSLKYGFNKGWSEGTSRAFATKFLNWLMFAGVMTKKGKEYILTDQKPLSPRYQDSTRKQTHLEEDMPMEQVIQGASEYYRLGKLIGQMHSSISQKEVKDDVNKVIDFCRKDGKLKDVLEGWEEDLNLYNELNDPRIFLRDIKALEKAMGVKA